MTRAHPASPLCLAAIAWLLVGAAGADRLELIRYTDLWAGSPVRSADASAVTYLPATGHLLIADSEISEYGEATDPRTGAPVFDGHNVFESTLDASARLGAYLAAPPEGTRREPVGVVYNPADGHLYVTDDDRKRIDRYRFDDERRFGLPVASTITGVDGGYTDPEGITCDPMTGDLFVVSGTREERILRFRFDVEADSFVFVHAFPIHEHAKDPEGIAFDTDSGHLFTVSSDGIDEFTAAGTFVQHFGFTFLEPHDVTFTLPGGLTFAPSSDPNDPLATRSLYVTCRGVDNDSADRNTLDAGLAELRLVRETALLRALRVPQDFGTLQAAVQAAAEGDTILVSPGQYAGPLDLGSRAVALVSEHFLGDSTAIDRTVIDGGGGGYAVRIGAPDGEVAPGGPRPLLWGFTIRNADDGITATAPFDLVHSRVTATTDGIDYEGGGGSVRHCLFDHNRDDAIDLDGTTAARIEHCRLVDNGDDGIEVRLHAYTGPDTLEIVVRDNTIVGNDEDGIQLIGYDVATARRFTIAGNHIADNAMAGIGMMAGANTREDYQAAPLPEPVLIHNNTFARNDHHVAGGGNVLVVNNIFTRARTVALKGIGGASLVQRNLMWRNAARGDDGALEAVQSDPRFRGMGLAPGPGSAAVDAGLWEVEWRRQRWRLAAPGQVHGEAPDLGAHESWIGTSP